MCNAGSAQGRDRTYDHDHKTVKAENIREALQ
jgi:hypothetical protein